MSQAVLAELATEAADGRASVTDRTIRHWENGETVPRLGFRFMAVCAVLRVSASYLLWGAKED